jgi:hypothetical protein
MVGRTEASEPEGEEEIDVCPRGSMLAGAIK